MLHPVVKVTLCRSNWWVISCMVIRQLDISEDICERIIKWELYPYSFWAYLDMLSWGNTVRSLQTDMKSENLVNCINWSSCLYESTSILLFFLFYLFSMFFVVYCWLNCLLGIIRSASNSEPSPPTAATSNIHSSGGYRSLAPSIVNYCRLLPRWRCPPFPVACRNCVTLPRFINYVYWC